MIATLAMIGSVAEGREPGQRARTLGGAAAAEPRARFAQPRYPAGLHRMKAARNLVGAGNVRITRGHFAEPQTLGGKWEAQAAPGDQGGRRW
jgi:hypothetical protein